MRKITALLLAVVMVISLAACAAPKATETAAETAAAAAADVKASEITLWTYPIGGWGDAETVDKLMADFKAATGISVKVEYLDYTNGDDQVNTAIEGKSAPDLIMEGPERLVANWGAKGYMVDIADLWDADDKKEVNAACQSACFTADGKCYEFPVVMTAHCMAVNYTALEKAGKADLVNKDTHTWTTQQFKDAVAALYAAGNDPVAAIFCGGQGGDQGTRAIINNMYGGTFTNPEHTAYTADSAENIKALEELQAMDGINFDASIVGGDEINLFRQGILKMAFCWNIAQQLNEENNAAGLTNDGDEIVFMSFPAEDGNAKLCGGIWGFGIFDNGDAGKIAAAKEFIRYFGDGEGTEPAVKAAQYFAARTAVHGKDLSGIWADNAIMNEYNKLMPYLGDYYQVAGGWAEARTAWWNMLQAVGSGAPVADSVKTFCETANAAAK